MTIYKVSNIDGMSDYFVSEQTIIDSSKNNPFIGSITIGTKNDAELRLKENQKKCLDLEANRFNVLVTEFIGDDIILRPIKDNDKEENLYRVFNHSIGQYEEFDNKKEALLQNENLKNEFLKSLELDMVYIVNELPIED